MYAWLFVIEMDTNNGMFPLGILLFRKVDGEHWNKFLEMLSPELKMHHLPLSCVMEQKVLKMLLQHASLSVTKCSILNICSKT